MTQEVFNTESLNYLAGSPEGIAAWNAVHKSILNKKAVTCKRREDGTYPWYHKHSFCYASDVKLSEFKVIEDCRRTPEEAEGTRPKKVGPKKFSNHDICRMARTIADTCDVDEKQKAKIIIITKEILNKELK